MMPDQTKSARDGPCWSRSDLELTQPSGEAVEGRGADTRARRVCIISLPLARRHPNLGPTLAEPSPDQLNHLYLGTGKRYLRTGS